MRRGQLSSCFTVLFAILHSFIVPCIAAVYSKQESEERFLEILTYQTTETKKHNEEMNKAHDEYVRCRHGTKEEAGSHLRYIGHRRSADRQVILEIRELLSQSQFSTKDRGYPILELYKREIQYDEQKITMLEKALEDGTSSKKGFMQAQNKVRAQNGKQRKQRIKELQQILEIRLLPGKISEFLRNWTDGLQSQVQAAAITGNKSLVTQCKEWARDFKKPLMAGFVVTILASACNLGPSIKSAQTGVQQLKATQVGNQISTVANQSAAAKMISDGTLSPDGKQILIKGAPPIPFASSSGLSESTLAGPKGRKLLLHQEQPDG